MVFPCIYMVLIMILLLHVLLFFDVKIINFKLFFKNRMSNSFQNLRAMSKMKRHALQTGIQSTYYVDCLSNIQGVTSLDSREFKIRVK